MSKSRPETRHDIYTSPLVERNASDEMAALFSPQFKHSTWRRLWLALAESEQQLGLDIPDEAVTQLRAHLDDIDFARAAEHERALRHDVMAHIHTLGEAAPAAKPFIHLGATSCYVTDNTELIQLRDGLKLLAPKLAAVIGQLGDFAAKYRALPTLGFTHYQPAQLVTVGKRATLWAQDFATDLLELERRLGDLRARGVKGTTGTQASFLALFDGDHGKVEQLDRVVCRKIGFERSYAVTGQTYPRKVDAQVADALAGVAISAHKFANDMRLLANLRQVDEPFEDKQVGSSAMAYKRNPMRCERITALARLVMSLADSPRQTAAEQWFERTLDDSANRRVAIAELFLAVDGILRILLNVTAGMVVNEAVIARAVADELPFMATENILMAAVAAGGDRQDLHERIRTHSLAAVAEIKAGRSNDLLARLGADRAFAKVDIGALLDPARFVGRSPQQVDAFLAEVVAPIRRRYGDAAAGAGQLRV
ncbi:MAG: Adenylosuccinate lyase [Phycisphaerae bacterium]|nr:Adenylosuccinate lyase [Phycisphaerae bacterium]